DNVYRLGNPKAFNEDPPNKLLREQYLAVYVCPADVSIGGFTPLGPASGPGAGIPYMPGSYRAMSGKSDGNDWFDDSTCAFPRSWRGALHSTWTQTGLAPERLQNITDGTSNTIMLGEYATRTEQARRTFWAYTYTSYNQSSAVPQARTLLNDFDRCTAIGGAGATKPPKHSWGRLHPNSPHLLLCDGLGGFLTPHGHTYPFMKLRPLLLP